MNRFRSWLERLLGLQSDVEHQVEQSVRLNAALAGAVIRAEAASEARAFAAEIEATNPELAAAVRAAVAEHTGTALPTGPAPCAANPQPARLPAAAGKRAPGRPRKITQLPPADTQPGGPRP